MGWHLFLSDSTLLVSFLDISSLYTDFPSMYADESIKSLPNYFNFVLPNAYRPTISSSFYGNKFFFYYPTLYIYKYHHSHFLHFDFFLLDTYSIVTKTQEYTNLELASRAFQWRLKEFNKTRTMSLEARAKYEVPMAPKMNYFISKRYKVFGYFPKFQYKFYHNYPIYYTPKLWWFNFDTISIFIFERISFYLIDWLVFVDILNLYLKLNWYFIVYFYNLFLYYNLIHYFMDFFFNIYLLNNNLLNISVMSLNLYFFNINLVKVLVYLYKLVLLNLVLFLYFFIKFILNTYNIVNLNFFFTYLYQNLILLIERFNKHVIVYAKNYDKNSIKNLNLFEETTPHSFLYKLWGFRNFFIYERIAYILNYFWFYNYVNFIYKLINCLTYIRYIFYKFYIYNLFLELAPYVRLVWFFFRNMVFDPLFNLIWHFLYYLHIIIVQFLFWDNHYNLIPMITPKWWKRWMPDDKDDEADYSIGLEGTKPPVIKYHPSIISQLPPFFTYFLLKLRPIIWNVYYFFDNTPKLSFISFLKFIFISIINIINFFISTFVFVWYKGSFFLGFLCYYMLRLKITIIHLSLYLHKKSLVLIFKRILKDFLILVFFFIKIFLFFFKPISLIWSFLWNIYLFLILFIINFCKFILKSIYKGFNIFFRKNIFLSLFSIFVLYSFIYNLDPYTPFLYFFSFFTSFVDYLFIQPWDASFNVLEMNMKENLLVNMSDLFRTIRTRRVEVNTQLLKMIRFCETAVLSSSKLYKKFSLFEALYLYVITLKLKFLRIYLKFSNYYLTTDFEISLHFSYFYLICFPEYFFKMGLHYWIFCFSMNLFKKIPFLKSSSFIVFFGDYLDFFKKGGPKNSILNLIKNFQFYFSIFFEDLYFTLYNKKFFHFFPKIENIFIHYFIGNWNWFFYFYFLDFFYSLNIFSEYLYKYLTTEVQNNILYLSFFLENIWSFLFTNIINLKLNYFSSISDINIINKGILNFMKSNNQYILENWDTSYFGFFTQDFYYRSWVSSLTFGRSHFYDSLNMYLKLRSRTLDTYKQNIIYHGTKDRPGAGANVGRGRRPVLTGLSIRYNILTPTLSKENVVYSNNNYFTRAGIYSIFNIWNFNFIDENINADIYNLCYKSNNAYLNEDILTWFEYLFRPAYWAWIDETDILLRILEDGLLFDFTVDTSDRSNFIFPYVNLSFGPWVANSMLWVISYPIIFPLFLSLDERLRKIFYPWFFKNEPSYDYNKFRSVENPIDLIKSLSFIGVREHVAESYLKDRFFFLKSDFNIIGKTHHFNFTNIQKDLNIESIQRVPIYNWDSTTLNHMLLDYSSGWNQDENFFLYVNKLINEGLPNSVLKYELLSMLRLLNITKQEWRLWNVILVGREFLNKGNNKEISLKGLTDAIVLNEANEVFKEFLKLEQNNILLVSLFDSLTKNLNVYDGKMMSTVFHDEMIRHIAELFTKLRILFFKYTTPSFFIFMARHQLNPSSIDFTNYYYNEVYANSELVNLLNSDSLSTFRYYFLHDDKYHKVPLYRNIYNVPLWGEIFLDEYKRDYFFNKNMKSIFEDAKEISDNLENYYLQIDRQILNFNSPIFSYSKHTLPNKIFNVDPLKNPLFIKGLKNLNDYRLKINDSNLFSNSYNNNFFSCNKSQKLNKMEFFENLGDVQNEIKLNIRKAEVDINKIPGARSVEDHQKEYLDKYKLRYLPSYNPDVIFPLLYFCFGWSYFMIELNFVHYNLNYSNVGIGFFFEVISAINFILCSNDFFFTGGKLVFFSNLEMKGLDNYNSKRPFKNAHRQKHVHFTSMYQYLFYDSNHYFNQYPRHFYGIVEWWYTLKLYKYFYSLVLFDGYVSLDCGYSFYRYCFFFKLFIFLCILKKMSNIYEKTFKWRIFSDKAIGGNKLWTFYSDTNTLRLDVYFYLKRRLLQGGFFFFNGSSHKT